MNESEKTKSKNSKIAIIISIIVILIVLIAVVVPKLMNKTENVEEKEQLTKWEDAYISYMQQTDLGGLNTGLNTEMQLINVEGNSIPTLIARFDSIYEKVTSKNLQIYQADENGEIVVNSCFSGDCKLKLLYNKEKNNYEWFIYREFDDNNVYESLKDNMEYAKDLKNNNNENIQVTQFTFYKPNEYSMEQTKEKFDEQYIEVDCDDIINNWIKYDKSEEKTNLIDKLKSELEINKKTDNIVPEEKNKEIIAKVEQEKAKKEAEKKAKEEEEKSKLTVGEYTLKYGKYTSLKGMDIDPITIVLNADKTCSYSGLEPSGGSKVINEKGTYKVELDKDDGYGELVDWIILNLNDGTRAPFIVYGNDYFGSQWLGFEYSNGTTSSNSSNKQNSSTANNTTPSTSNANTNSNASVSETPTLTNAITQDEALKLAQKKWGTHADETGFDIGYSYVAWIQDEQGMQYYVFDVRWFVNNDHWSWIDTVCISVDGKTYREIASPANFKNGEIVKQFDSKGEL